jgi:phytoene dehydrogenase-like protein
LECNRDAYESQKVRYTQKIIVAINQILPCFENHITLALAGTPTTYHYYTGRHLGMVGGFPQTSLLKPHGPRTGISNLRLVGDSIFPGQSTAAVSLGAMRVVDDVVHHMNKLAH